MSKDLIIIIGITVLMIMVYGKYWGNGIIQEGFVVYNDTPTKIPKLNVPVSRKGKKCLNWKGTGNSAYQDMNHNHCSKRDGKYKCIVEEQKPNGPNYPLQNCQPLYTEVRSKERVNLRPIKAKYEEELKDEKQIVSIFEHKKDKKMSDLIRDYKVLKDKDISLDYFIEQNSRIVKLNQQRLNKSKEKLKQLLTKNNIDVDLYNRSQEKYRKNSKRVVTLIKWAKFALIILILSIILNALTVELGQKNNNNINNNNY
tara:strand:+ start:234 stop:1001 length:768 start_codon:yes stop_codon:yes gene_type:complete